MGNTPDQWNAICQRVEMSTYEMGQGTAINRQIEAAIAAERLAFSTREQAKDEEIVRLGGIITTWRDALSAERQHAVIREQALQAEVDRLKTELTTARHHAAARLASLRDVEAEKRADLAQARLDGLRKGFQAGLAEDGPPMLSQTDFESWCDARFAAFLASTEQP